MEIKPENDVFASLSKEEREKIIAEQKQRRKDSQVSIMKLQKHGDLIAALVPLDTDQARKYVTMMGEAGVGKLTDEQEDEITQYINDSWGSKINDLAKSATIIPDMHASSLTSQDLMALCFAQVMKE